MEGSFLRGAGPSRCGQRTAVGRGWMGDLLPVALGVAAVCLVLLRQTEFGPGLTADSGAFVSTARNVFAGAGLVPFFGDYSHRPPLYPLILAATGFFHDDMIAAAGVLNAVAFGLSVFVTAAWLRRRQVWAPLVAWAGLALALSPMAGVAAYVWAESVFVLFALAALYFLDRFLVTGMRRALLVSAGFAALCCLTRYAGASVLVCATVLIAARRQWPAAERIRAVAFYAAVGTAPTALWLVRHLLVMDSLFGDWSHNQDFPATAVFHMVVETLLGTAVGPAVLDGIENEVGWLLAVCGLVAGALVRWRRAAAAALAPACFAVCYLALLTVASVWPGLSAAPRYAAPLIAPILLVCALALDACASPAGAKWLGRGPRWRRWLVAAAMTTALSLWLAQWVAPNLAEVKQWRVHGGDGYGARRWADSATVASLRSGTGASDGLLASNDPFAVYLLTGGGTALHRSGNDRISPVPYDRKRPPLHVVWFYAPLVPSATNLMTFLGASPRMRAIATHADGITFQRDPQGRQGLKDDAEDAVARLAEALLRRTRQDRIVAMSHFDVFLGSAQKRLTYVKHGCEATDVDSKFFLHVTPSDPVNLPLRRAGHLRSPVLAGFHNLDFVFAGSGVRHRNVCIATRALPSYAIAEIRTGQWSPDSPGETWSTRFTLPPQRSPQGEPNAPEPSA